MNTLPHLPMGSHYTRLTFSLAQCAHEYETPCQVAGDMAREAGLRVVLVRRERGTIAVYAIEPSVDDALGWQAYRDLPCSSARSFG